MEKITSIIVDDEKGSREVLNKLLVNFFPEVEVVGEAANVDDAYKLINEKNPQLVFLDIQMPKATGFDLLKKFEKIPFEVIFITSFDKYAINAIKFSALDYLLKPVDISELREAITKAGESIALKRQRNTRIINLLNNLEAENDNRKIAVHAGENVILLHESEILYIEADGRYCIITGVHEKYTTARSLKEFEEYFSQHSVYVRIHKSCLINTRHINKYSKGEPCIIEMRNGATFEVARRKKQEILRKLKS